MLWCEFACSGMNVAKNNPQRKPTQVSSVALRCPSCRSQVKASDVECPMCGFDLTDYQAQQAQQGRDKKVETWTAKPAPTPAPVAPSPQTTLPTTPPASVEIKPGVTTAVTKGSAVQLEPLTHPEQPEQPEQPEAKSTLADMPESSPRHVQSPTEPSSNLPVEVEAKPLSADEPVSAGSSVSQTAPTDVAKPAKQPEQVKDEARLDAQPTAASRTPVKGQTKSSPISSISPVSSVSPIASGKSKASAKASASASASANASANVGTQKSTQRTGLGLGVGGGGATTKASSPAFASRAKAKPTFAKKQLTHTQVKVASPAGRASTIHPIPILIALLCVTFGVMFVLNVFLRNGLLGALPGQLQPGTTAPANAIAQQIATATPTVTLTPSPQPQSTETPVATVPASATPQPTANGTSATETVLGTRQYTVKQGDTCDAIARTYGVRVDMLAAVNKLDSRCFLRVGMTLTIPNIATEANAAQSEPTTTPISRATSRTVPTPTQTSVPTATATATATRTPRPTNTPVPTRTPRPTATATATATVTNTPAPTATATTTRTPRPTNTPVPTRTPRPTRTPIPTRTPRPTATPTPTREGTLPPIYVVRAGDTCLAIARRLGVQLDDLLRLNNLNTRCFLQIGDRLFVPGAPQPTATATQPPTATATATSMVTPSPVPTQAPTQTPLPTPLPTIASGASPDNAANATTATKNTSNLAVELVVATYDRSGRPRTRCGNFDEADTVRKYTFTLGIVNNTAKDLTSSAWGAVAFTNRGQAFQLCYFDTEGPGVPALRRATAQRVTLSAYMENDESIVAILVGDDAGNSTRICVRGSEQVACE
jgi:LysM repeat protein